MASKLASCYGWRFTEKNTFIDVGALEDGLEYFKVETQTVGAVEGGYLYFECRNEMFCSKSGKHARHANMAR